MEAQVRNNDSCCILFYAKCLLYPSAQALRKDAYDHYTAIYYLLLDRLRHHRSSFPTDTRVDARRRRPSTIAEQAMLQNIPGRPLIGTTKHGGFSKTLDAPGAGTVLVHRNYPLAEVDVVPPPPSVPHCMTEMLPKPFPKSSQVACGAGTVAGGSVITTSIDEGVEVDFMDRRDSDVESVTGMGMGYTSKAIGSFSSFGVSQPEMIICGSIHNQSCGSVVSGTLSPCTSIDSSLGVEFSAPSLASTQLQQQQPRQSVLPAAVSSCHTASVPVTLDGGTSNVGCGDGGGDSVVLCSESSGQYLVNLYPNAVLNQMISCGGGISRHGRYSISGPSGALTLSANQKAPCNPQFLQVMTC